MLIEIQGTYDLDYQTIPHKLSIHEIRKINKIYDIDIILKKTI